MKTHDFFILALLIFVGTFAALIAWTLIVKQQISASVGNNSGLGAIFSLFGGSKSS